jgi:hypothetical protein
MGFVAIFRALFRIKSEGPNSKALRVLVTSGEYAGKYGWCSEPRRLTGEEPAVFLCIPVDLDEGAHIHATREQVEVVKSPPTE